VKALTPYDAKAILKHLIKNVRIKQYSKESLTCCLNITRNFTELSSDLIDLLKSMQPQFIKRDLIPSFRNESWSEEVFKVWKDKSGIDPKVKTEIERT
ncbi:TPA: hypothetical protein J0A02_005054, partial [Escherichia coli]|nr:hypothetical protein [Escherichia coli]